MSLVLSLQNVRTGTDDQPMLPLTIGSLLYT
jgi:hypothetical protein